MAPGEVTGGDGGGSRGWGCGAGGSGRAGDRGGDSRRPDVGAVDLGVVAQHAASPATGPARIATAYIAPGRGLYIAGFFLLFRVPLFLGCSCLRPPGRCPPRSIGL